MPGVRLPHDEADGRDAAPLPAGAQPPLCQRAGKRLQGGHQVKVGRDVNCGSHEIFPDATTPSWPWESSASGLPP